METDFIASSQKVCYFFGISRETLRRWSETATFPKSAQIQRGVYDVRQIFLWRDTHIVGNKETAKKLQEAKLKYQISRSRKEELSVLSLEKDLISLSKLRSDLADIFLGFKSNLLQWEKKLPPLLEGRDARAMLPIIHTEVVTILNNFAKGGEFLFRKHSTHRK
jgi:hypothetical protein